MDLSTLIIWMSPFLVLMVPCGYFHFIVFCIEISETSRVDPNQMPRSVASN